MTQIQRSGSSPRVGFAGLGSMGLGMAVNLVKAGYAVAGFDPSEQARKSFEASGGIAVDSLEELCEANSSHYFVMVATAGQVDSVMFGTDGLVAHLPQNAAVCLCCTLPPTYVVDLPKRLENCGREDLRLVDCPVSGGAIGALKGTLSIMMAGDEPVIEELNPELKAMAAPDRLFYYGALGTASTLKMLNQHLAGTHIVAAAEILAFARSLGLSTREALKVLQASPASSWILGDRGEHMLDADWTPKSAVEIFVKDLGIVNDCADEVSFACPLASEAFSVFLKTTARGFGRQDDAFVVNNYEQITKKKVAEPEREPPASENRDGLAAGHFAPLSSLDPSPRVARLLESLNVEQQGDASGPQITIFEHGSGPIDEVNEKLAALGAGSIVVVIGLSDKQRVAAFEKDIKDQHSHIQVVNGQIIPNQECAMAPQASERKRPSDSPDTLACVQKALPSSIASHGISGSFESATLMSLTIRYGSIIHVAAAAELYGLIVAMGIPPELVYKLVAGAAGSSTQFIKQFPFMINRDFDISSQDSTGLWNEFSLQCTAADSKILQSLTRSLMFPATLLNAAHQIIKDANARGSEQHTSLATIVCRWDK
ncbi:hypothetical protein AbraIFM66951_003627 [Aspergillus brasiliensis]|uniref:6-phosphogluconate dehydrogenase NADP-binding domain-containing protein n=1 Tax=Aspergillus brasiliensis TaxID=319629 RepID=A0A9W6DR28_9EURO|nr:hypothetical protein AbraCBS73388_002566 [Aspergillus brasiliensis]GKZ50490.1 hypothetical protein AbraIFM66951_003627 [Aspergillus brasiliensis]